MKPVLFSIPLPWGWSVPVRAYGFMVMLGCLAAIFVALRRARREGSNPNIIWDIWMWSLIGGFLGARLFYVYLFWDQFRGNPWSTLYFWEGGLAFQGGLVGAFVCVYLYMRARRLSYAKYLDMVAAGVILGYGFARVGCFLNGCCHGDVTPARWAVTYPAAAPIDGRGTLRPSPAYSAQESGVPRRLPDWLLARPEYKDRVIDGQLRPRWEYLALVVKRGLPLSPDEQTRYAVTLDDYRAAAAEGRVPPMPCTCPVHPTQLYSTGYALIIFALLLIYARLPHHVGQEVSLFGMLYAVARFTVEFFRGDSPMPYGGLTVFQAACIGIFAVFAAAWLWCQFRMPRHEPPKPVASSAK